MARRHIVCFWSIYTSLTRCQLPLSGRWNKSHGSTHLWTPFLSQEADTTMDDSVCSPCSRTVRRRSRTACNTTPYSVTLIAMNTETPPLSPPTHAQLDERSWRWHCEIADRIRENPALAEVARRNIARWKRQLGESAARDLDVWDHLLAGPLEPVLAILTARTEEATRLRQSTPFCGIISQERRQVLLREDRERRYAEQKQSDPAPSSPSRNS